MVDGRPLRDGLAGAEAPEPSARLGPSDGIPVALEFRPDHKGRFDEIIARFADGMIHAEMMSKKALYIGFYWDDGRYCQVWINSDKKLTVHHEDGISDPPRFTAQGIDTTATSLSPSPALPRRL